MRNEGRKGLRSFSNFWPEEVIGRRVGGIMEEIRFMERYVEVWTLSKTDALS